MTEEQLKAIYKDINLDVWATLASLNKCMYGCKGFKEPLYVMHENKSRTLNPAYIFHIQSTHGLPAINFVDMIANKIYKTQEAKEKMLKLYAFLEK